MPESNQKVSPLQVGILTYFLTNSILVGLATINIVHLGRNDVWLITFSSIIPGFLLVLLIIYIMNYKPNKTIFGKMKSLMGNWVGNIINLILCLYFLLLTMVVVREAANFAMAQYLLHTPLLILLIFLMVAVVYAVTKGIETICRVGESLLFLAILAIVVIISSLWKFSHFFMVRPILTEGVSFLVKNQLFLLFFTFIPLILIMVIPKNNIVKNKHYHWYIIGGFLAGLFTLGTFYYLLISLVGPDLATLYKYPFYYLEKKISITQEIDKIENFVALNMFFNMFIFVSLGVYFVSRYIQNIFKGRIYKSKPYFIYLIGLIVTIGARYIYTNEVQIIHFYLHYYPYYVALVLFAILVITCLLIFVEQLKKKH